MKYLALLLTLSLNLNVATACPEGKCHDKDCPEAKVHTTGVGGGVTEAGVHGHSHGHHHDAEHAEAQAKFRLKPEGAPRPVKQTKAAPKIKNG